jgi:hypothetical protein
MTPISAVNAISPSLEWTRNLLFRPFRLSVWIRFAVLGFLTGEMSSGGGFNFSLPPMPKTHGSESQHLLPSMGHLPPYVLPVIIVLAAALVVLVLVFMYLGSVFRFVLLEAVITGRVRLREGFARWQDRGQRLFVWQLIYAVVLWTAVAVVIGTPLLVAWSAGVFRNPHSHLALLILGGILLFGALLILFAVAMIIWVLTKDFVAPIMALERVGPVEGWRRLLPLMTTQKGSYAGYIGMKIALALAAGILVGIAGFIAVLLLLVPAGIVALVAYFAAQAMGVGWSVWTITAAIVAGAVLLALLLFLMAMIAVPMVVFFQCYVLRFFAGRYEPLARWMYPPQLSPTP